MVLVLMIFMHLVDDYKLQGILSNLKQKDWWEENYPDALYKKDYIVALLEHAFMNSVMVHIPIYFLLCKDRFSLFITFFTIFISHAFIDNIKANLKICNLFTDQLLHILIIILTYILYLRLNLL